MSTPGDTSDTFCATLVDEWIRHGVQHAVIAPGSRSTPLAVQLARRLEISVHLFHDERSASFAAVGIGEATGVPAILLCTSGTAAAHFYGAVIEAHQAHVPMIVCTADRPPELRDVGAPQTIDQTQMFGTAVRWFHDPGVPSDDAAHTWRSLASRCFAVTRGARPGPVHLNLPFREPLLGSVGEMPQDRPSGWSTVEMARSVSPHMVNDLVTLLSGRRGIVVAGKGATPEVLRFAQRAGWPVFADPRSGVRVCEPNVVIAFDSILRSTQFADSHVPDVVLRVGEPPASKVTAQWLSRHNVPVVQVTPHEFIIDADHRMNHTFIAPIAEMFAGLTEQTVGVDDSWSAEWNAAETVAQSAISEWTQNNWSEPAHARALTDALTPGTHFVVSSSMPIRDVEWFGTVTPDVVVHSNRGTNGIDGVISTAVGIATSTGAPTVVFVGDVACLHDSNGLLGVMQRGVDVKVVVTNNDGGSIFSFLPQATQVDETTFELLYGTPHNVSFEALAAAHGIPYHRATNASSLVDALHMAGTRFIEVPFSRGENVGKHDAVNFAVVNALQNAGLTA